jgi:tripartite-type tricarboxylate transporter receptor subunit TctC
MRRMTRRQLLIASAAMPFVATRARAAGYPDKPIRVVIPYTAGGVPETVTRLLAVSLEQRLGQKLVIEAKPGAGGNLGTREVARAAPDGLTLLVAATNNFVINQFVMRMEFDPLAALAPIAKLADVPLVLFSNPQVPVHNLQELVAYAKTNKVNYGVPGIGTVNHLLIERLKQVTHADIGLVPYRGSAPAALALIKNEIQIFPIGLAAVGGNLAEGKLTALAVATEKRIPMLPDVPTMAESGFPGLLGSNWFGMAAPAGTPDDILDVLAVAVAEAQQTALVKERFIAMGMLVPELPRAQFAESLKTEAAQWHETTQRGHITIE